MKEELEKLQTKIFALCLRREDLVLSEVSPENIKIMRNLNQEIKQTRARISYLINQLEEKK